MSVPSSLSPVFIVSCIRSGSTILESTLHQALPTATPISNGDFEGNLFWAKNGVQLGTPKTGSHCSSHKLDDLTPDAIERIRHRVGELEQQGARVVSKNPHFSNKLGLLKGLFPNVRIVHLVRFGPSVISSTKSHFKRLHQGENARGVSITHYWPKDQEYPCWRPYADSNRLVKPNISLKERLRLHYRRQFVFPKGKLHSTASALAQNPDPLQYYPGEGFACIAESWLSINAGIIQQVEEFGLQDQYMAINYADLVADTHRTIQSVADFIGQQCVLDDIPKQLEMSCQNKWEKQLSHAEIDTIKQTISPHSNQRQLIKDTLPGPLFLGDD